MTPISAFRPLLPPTVISPVPRASATTAIALRSYAPSIAVRSAASLAPSAASAAPAAAAIVAPPPPQTSPFGAFGAVDGAKVAAAQAADAATYNAPCDGGLNLVTMSNGTTRRRLECTAGAVSAITGAASAALSPVMASSGGGSVIGAAASALSPAAPPALSPFLTASGGSASVGGGGDPFAASSQVVDQARLLLGFNGAGSPARAPERRQRRDVSP